MIRGNMFDTFSILFDDGQETSMIAKDADKAHALAQSVHPWKQITTIRKISNDDHDG